MNGDWIDEEFPGIYYTITSEEDDAYNCVAWAAGYNNGWWSHGEGYRWIGERSASVRSLVLLFNALGYTECDSDALEAGYEKVALYAKEGDWTHAARQLANGRWTSKLGMYEDIEHAGPEDMCGDLYGGIHCIMTRHKES